MFILAVLLLHRSQHLKEAGLVYSSFWSIPLYYFRILTIYNCYLSSTNNIYLGWSLINFYFTRHSIGEKPGEYIAVSDLYHYCIFLSLLSRMIIYHILWTYIYVYPMFTSTLHVTAFERSLASILQFLIYTIIVYHISMFIPAVLLLPRSQH